ncbi:unnamed protein product [Cylicocyclus nassatus]|uniref:H15 domain-containing protein n=1 Tax=Cylicocyclus nassatus TaxID=53992 RepID=A0AA36HC84_CYLNA|nr:unnamed protein product [Cylicocyclus nassatus]
MSSSAPTSPKVAKSPKARSSSKSGAKKTASHPTYSAMIRKAVVELKDKSGSSKSAILKYILQNYKLGENVAKVNAQLRTAIKKGVIKGDLKQVKGSGASGSFKLAEKKAAAPKVKKPVAKKPASGASGEKKATTPKKKRSSSKKPKAEKKAKSPKKARKPKAKSAKKPSAAKSPKKSTMKKSKKVSKPKTAKKATTKA